MSQTAAPFGSAARKSSCSNRAAMPCIPIGVVFTRRSEKRAQSCKVSSSKPQGVICVGNSFASASALERVRLHTKMRRAPDCASFSTTARAAPPAPSTVIVLSSGEMPASNSICKNPRPSVLQPRIFPSRSTTVFTARYSCASASSSSTSSTRSVLWGMVALKPAYPSSAARRRKAAVSPPRTRTRPYT